MYLRRDKPLTSRCPGSPISCLKMSTLDAQQLAVKLSAGARLQVVLTATVTSTLPFTALEYGQTACPAATTFSASA
jgi:hypothetical protein